MGKQNWKPGNMLNPVPAVMVSGYLVGEGARTMLIVFGVVSILAAIASLCSLVSV